VFLFLNYSQEYTNLIMIIFYDLMPPHVIQDFAPCTMQLVIPANHETHLSEIRMSLLQMHRKSLCVPII
jgi:hypothetical protein